MLTLYCSLDFKYDSIFTDPFSVPSPINHSLSGLVIAIMMDLICVMVENIWSYHGDSLGAL